MNVKKLSVLLSYFVVTFGFAQSDYMHACIDDYPPFQYVGSPPHGIHVTALTRLANTLNREIKFIEAPNFARCVRLLKNGDVDVIAGLNINEERKEFAFYAPYKIEQDLVIISRYSDQISNYQSLQGRVIGVPRGTTYFRKFNQDTSLIKTPTQSIRTGIELIIRNRIDVIITSELVANLFMADITEAHLKTTIIKRDDNNDKISYFGFSKKNKLNLSQEEVIQRTTHAFEQGKFIVQPSAENEVIKE